MKRLTYFVAILALIYSGYWAVGSYALKNTVQNQLTTLENNGWLVDYSALNTRGFPSRFDTTATDLNITAPDQSISYMTDIVQVLALSYRPNHAIIAFAPEQSLILDGLPIEIASDGLRASVGVNANTSLSLDAVTAEAKSLQFNLEQGTISSLNDALFAMRESSAAPNTYDTYFTSSDIAWPALILGQLPADNRLPETVDAATIDAAITLDRPIDRLTLSAWQTDPANLRGVDLRSLSITWGPFVITGNGSFTINEAGTPDGTITLTANDWKGILAAAQSLGVISEQYQFMAQSIGETLSQGDDTLVLPITVANGNLSIGPLPLGPAPKF
ncbi:hypothetical protein FHS72_002784 [Loktanella ponticola]|uniref:DUF2125 domain-containing protein n=1 Tax=Yoonia ponticola TaxID=1524255 RepID=A0A7W9BMA2_9RHOB|nr:DUF2125 domain-containing protein [Yoonia ponticola]MBB5723147.1 hypothetical protein [Yoonia ponticola]